MAEYRWRSVEDGLPPDMAEVLVFYKGRTRRGWFRADLQSWAVEEYGTMVPIRWWMPRLEPPPGENDTLQF